MKNLKTRVLSGAMAGVLALSLAVPAFASSNTTTVTGTYNNTPISVTVPQTGAAFINPYGLDIQVPQDAEDSANTNKATITGQQILTAPMAIKNKSGMNLGVSVTVTGAIDAGSDMKFSATSTKGNGKPESDPDYVAPVTSKSAFVYLQAKSAPTLTGADADVDAAAVATAYAAWGEDPYDATTDVVVGIREAKGENIVTLKAATQASGAFSAYKAGSVALVRLSGDCVTAPRGNAWAATDKFTATLAYTFAPVELAKYAITVSDPTEESSFSGTIGTVESDLTSTSEGETVTITVTLDNDAADDATVTVTTKSGKTVAVTGPTETSGATRTFTFTMPAEEVTVATEFKDA